MKKRILFLNYLIWKPVDPGFKDKFDVLSKYYSGIILHLGTGATVDAEDFQFVSTRWKKNILLRQIGYVVFCLRKAKQKGPFDAIVSYDPLICGLTGVVIKLFTRAKLVVEVNTDHFWKDEGRGAGIKRRIINWIKMSCMRLTFRFADGVKCINRPLTSKYAHTFDFYERNLPVETFFSFIATDAFHTTGYTPNGPILCVGHPYHIKGVDVLLKAFNLISSDYPDVTLKIIGHCEDRERYEHLAAGNDKISFHDGMFFEKIVSEFENCRFLVLPSRTESMGRVLIEAMACGKPVIGSRVGGIPEVVAENETGLLFESDNASDLARKMRVLLDDPSLATRMGEAGQRRAKTFFSPAHYGRLYKAFLEQIMEGSKAVVKQNPALRFEKNPNPAVHSEDRSAGIKKSQA
ncbi:Glycosyltransferase involved in cell wall bisynthesis [Desulfonatronum thiosulfatophilum]|uniref:Glycosyltransferase involved in cell wall bisynthesis n=1 Tax=Desulfonatronum thiosulfatophilum TaxID=617002 RepID=A0A1G6EL75_9BACT|nr:glycosyltransferase family 4 protein [Desulfonatronum thiosulfatophilum]SDB58126.1 Glycosyltransferase involved in cell wall bisynthesis [Desulfonatronum thiosulfatophilum]